MFHRLCFELGDTWSPFSSTSHLSVDVEIAENLKSTTEGINLSTAGMLFIMGMGSLVWGPVASVSFVAQCQTSDNSRLIWRRYSEDV